MIKLQIDPVRIYNKKWHQNVMNLLLGKNVCGSCLCLNEDLVQWDVDFVLQRDDINMGFSLKNIMQFTFGSSIVDIVSSTKFCRKCINVILKAYFLLNTIHDNYKHIQSKLAEIAQQMKWTEHLDETGALKDIKNNVNHLGTKTQTNVGIETESLKESNVPVKQSKIKRKIMLDNESLKTKLIQDPEMHRFLFKKENVQKTKLPAGITVRKVRKSIDMTDIAPHELLELNWADETDYDSVIPNTQLSKNKLHSNEALIMNLMEKAKTGENCTNYKQNFNYVETFSKTPESLNLNDSLTVKLVHGSETNANSIDNTDLVPQYLLELKWPEDEDSKQCMKIPVKKLNFNEALTVKFIPKHNVCKSEDNSNDIAPLELLELNWQEEPEKVEVEHTNLPETEPKHKIDLTQWLQDQGMSIIKMKTSSHENKTHNTNAEEICLNANETTKNPPNELPGPKYANMVENVIFIKNDDVTKPKAKNNHHFETPVHEEDKLDYHDKVKIDVANDSERRDNIEALRCALCNLMFDQFESYKNHYKTHSIIEPAKCYKCPSQYPVIELLIEHLFLIHLESVTYCNVCFAMLNQDKLAEHMSTYHAQKIEVIGVWKEKIDNIKDDEYCKKCKQPYKLSGHPHSCLNADSQCTECKHACIHEKYLSSYRKQLKKRKEIFKCTDCKFKYRNKNEIIKHANKVHLKHKPHRCKVCNIGFLLKTSLGKHNNLYHARCSSCRRVFEDSRSMSKHKCNTVANDVQCELCGQSFSEDNYKVHKQSALAATDKCVVCQQTIPIKCNMSRHMQDIHKLCLKNDSGKTVYECIVCEREFENDADFSQHSLIHKDIYECHVCAKRFKTKALYETHYQMHLATQCNLAKSFKCSVCSEQLIDKYAWAHHMLSHKDYEKCQICSKYIQKETINQHVESHEVLDKKFKCPHCPLICNSHSQFEVHVNRFHLQNRPYQCDICKKCFYSKHLMREHIKLHSKPEQCGLCDKKFTKKGNLYIHMRVHSAS